MTGINTFMDCPYHDGGVSCYYSFVHGYKDGTTTDSPTWCEIYVQSKMCPMGFVK
jgi:hypothetical protein